MTVFLITIFNILKTNYEQQNLSGTHTHTHTHREREREREAEGFYFSK